MIRRGSQRRGFTLLEMSVVVFLMGLIMAIAMPYLLPVIAFSELEGSARHLSNYGRAAIAQATLFKEDVTIRFDLDAQEYYAVHWVKPKSEEGESEGEPEMDQMALLSKMRGGGNFSPEMFAESLAKGRSSDKKGLFEDMPDGFDDELANRQMSDRFEQFARRATETRAKNVIHEAGILDEIGPLFEEDEEFDLDEDEPVEEEIFDPVLERTRLPESVRLESVVVDGASSGSGVVEVTLSPLGLLQQVELYVQGEDGEYYSVFWDPVTGGTNVVEGK
jgi:prepilin-type N-terminal cleavage/methylation domain-containing protein